MSETPNESKPDGGSSADHVQSLASVDGRAGDQATTQSAIEKLGQRRPEVVQELLAFMGSGGASTLQQKMEPEHITALLGIAADHDEREFKLHQKAQDNTLEESRSSRRYLFAVFCVIVILFVVVLIVFQDKPDILVPCLTGLGGLTSGFLAGWGAAQRK